MVGPAGCTENPRVGSRRARSANRAGWPIETLHLVEIYNFVLPESHPHPALMRFDRIGYTVRSHRFFIVGPSGRKGWDETAGPGGWSEIRSPLKNRKGGRPRRSSRPPKRPGGLGKLLFRESRTIKPFALLCYASAGNAPPRLDPQRAYYQE